MSMAFEITSVDVMTVLSQNESRIVDMGGQSLEDYSETVFDLLGSEDFDAIESAALDGGFDLVEEQLPAAYEKLVEVLVDLGVLTG